jgi:hypothetical protein
MRILVEAIAARLDTFVAQRDHAALIIRASDADAITVLKCVENNDDGSVSELYWIHPEPFSTIPQYARDVVQSFAARHQAVSAAMKLKEMQPWPPIPAAILDESRDPSERMRELMIFSRSLLPAGEGALSVWALIPAQIADPISHSAFFDALLAHTNPFPWFHHLRFFVREDASGRLSQALYQKRVQRVDYFAPDLSNEAIRRSLDEEASSPDLPADQRIQALFLSAQCDFTDRNFARAMEKHAFVLQHHIASGNAPMAALSLHSIGEIHERLGRGEQAARCFENSFAVAAEDEQPQLPILLNALLSLANLRLGQNRLAEAEAYYDNAEKLSTVLRNPVTKLQSLENLGYCQYAQGKVDEAVQQWRSGAAIAEKLEQPVLEQNILARLRYHFFHMNQGREVRAIDTRLAALAQSHG